jgi:hypothetical protein
MTMSHRYRSQTETRVLRLHHVSSHSSMRLAHRSSSIRPSSKARKYRSSAGLDRPRPGVNGDQFLVLPRPRFQRVRDPPSNTFLKQVMVAERVQEAFHAPPATSRGGGTTAPTRPDPQQ